MQNHEHQHGFSLIELLIVVAIIGIVAAIALPNYLSSRRAANEASTIQSVRVITGAQATYHITSANGRYGTLAELGDAVLLDPLLASATTLGTSRSGYIFAVTNPNALNYVVGAAPKNTQSGGSNFSSDASGVIYRDTATPGVAPTAVGGTMVGN